ncbi:MAG: hypothetical protein P8R54_08585 [Myxococcota bacterium]|nr:hypothetical protein [Myxococcota bacterium]
MTLLLLLGCPPKTPAVVAPEPVVEVFSEPVSGRVENGRFADRRHDLSVAVPDGWRAELWPDTGPLRVSIHHEETGAWIEVWAFEPRLQQPAPRGSCTWDFIDTGTYRELLRPRMVASCTPAEPSDPRISAYLFDRGAVTWQLELHVPPEEFSAGRRACEALLSSVQL